MTHMDLLFKTKKCIDEHELIEAGDHVLVAVSGGIDSMVLLHLLSQLAGDVGFLVSAVHVNHRLRGADSDGDEEFVRGFCQRKNMPFYVARWKGPKRGDNLQDAARNFRYKTFFDTARKIGGDKVALAHNLEDQAETILLNLIRGAGLDGICGMNFRRESTQGPFLIRPLLNISRSEIESFAGKEGILFRSDVTNDQTKYNRNFIRHKIMPLIREINPSAPASIADMASLLQMDEAFLQAAAVKAFDQMVTERGERHLIIDGSDGSGFRGLAPSIRTRVLKLAYIKMAGSVAGITRDHILRMDEIATKPKKGGSYSLPNGLKFERRGTVLAIFKG